MAGKLHSFDDKGKPKFNIPYYVMEGVGLAIFMVSASFFTTLLESPGTVVHLAIPNGQFRLAIIALAMGLTAYFIFVSPWTAPSGSHINPAVTLARLRLGHIRFIDASFYILAQCIGGLIGVYSMVQILDFDFQLPPVNFVATVPGKNYSIWQAAGCELVIAFIMFSFILFSSRSVRWQKTTKPVSAALVSCFVYFAGPISGFGMNPARSLASAIPSGIWTAFPIYVICPIAGMWLATEVFLITRKGLN